MIAEKSIRVEIIDSERIADQATLNGQRGTITDVYTLYDDDDIQLIDVKLDTPYRGIKKVILTASEWKFILD
jgi:hypothetical protein